MKEYNRRLTSNAQVLRKNMTKEEKHLWYDFLKLLPIGVYRQHCIGSYIVDFYIASKGIVIELDGAQHFEKEHEDRDHKRDEFLLSQNIKVLRYTNLEVSKNFLGVCSDILKYIGLTFEDLK